MDIIKTIKNLASVQMMRYKVASQKGRVTKLENEVHKLQALVRDDILSLVESEKKYVGNKYRTYDSAVAEIDKKYNGTADWGIIQTGTIIDLRAAFSIGDGIKVVQKKVDVQSDNSRKNEGERNKEKENKNKKSEDREKQWIEAFLEYNDLDKEVIQEYAIEAEIEGKLAIKLSPDTITDAKGKEQTMINTTFISWSEKKYTVKTDPNDYKHYTELRWKPKDREKDEVLNENEFVYKKFGGRISRPNEAAPKMMKCLTHVENLDRALRDWREINRIFGGPILYMECQNEEEVAKAVAAFNDKNFKVKKILAGTGKLYFVKLDVGGVESIENEIITLAKMISGETGIPVHFLGLPELMSNRATAENLMEMIKAATNKNRETWKGAYEELIRKAIIMYNEVEKTTPLNPDNFSIKIPMITKEHWDHLEKIYLPAAVAGKISDEAFQEQIPGFDIEQERERKEEREASELEQVKRENDDLKIDMKDQGIFGRGGNQNAIP